MSIKRKQSSWRHLVLLLFVFPILGCNQGDSRVEINGSVSYQGKPINKGKIYFMPRNEELPQANCDIKDGSYQIDSESGVFAAEYEVRILAYKGTGKFTDLGPLYEHRKQEGQKQILPPKFNTKTELKVSITNDSKSYDFDLSP